MILEYAHGQLFWDKTPVQNLNRTQEGMLISYLDDLPESDELEEYKTAWEDKPKLKKDLEWLRNKFSKKSLDKDAVNFQDYFDGDIVAFLEDFAEDMLMEIDSMLEDYCDE